MENNQNDQKNQQPVSKTTQSTPQDGSNKETNPANPTATQKQGTEQRKDTGTPGSKPTPAPGSKQDNEKETDGTHGASKTGEPDAEPAETIKGGL